MKDITVISATSDSIILFFSSVSRCLFDIPFTGAFAKHCSAIDWPRPGQSGRVCAR